MAEEVEGKVKPADRLIELAKTEEIKLFRDGEPGQAWVTIERGDGALVTYRVKGTDFRRWLALLYYEVEKTNAGAHALRSALETLEAEAILRGPGCQVFLRVGRRPEGEVTYLDIADKDLQAVAIGPESWYVTPKPQARFQRPYSMRALPVPQPGGGVAALKKYLNVAEADFLLVLAWALWALRPEGPYPPLCLRGEQGSAKSTTARVLVSLTDPKVAPLRGLPRDERELFIQAERSWVIAIDNVSELPQWLSDALCRLATRGGYSTRQLYTDAEEVIFDASRPVILTGIGDFATAGDLRDRAILLDLPAIKEQDRRTDKEFWQAFDKEAPRLLGALLDVTVKALEELPHVELDWLPRMADFARWGVAVERALGMPEGAFMAAYQGNLNEANAGALEDTPVGAPLMALLEEKGDEGWEGTATELLNTLTVREGYEKKAPLGWPKTGKQLANTLRRLEPCLRKLGVEVEKPSGSSHKSRTWRLRLQTTAPTAPTAPKALNYKPEVGAMKAGDEAGQHP
jgi:hypothetical protein